MFGLVQQEYREVIDVEPGAILDVFNKMGSISITGWDQDYVEVVAIKQSLLGMFLDEVAIVIKGKDRLGVSSDYSSARSRIVGVEYQISVPEGMLVAQVDSSNGRISIENVSGNLKAKSSRGSIIIRNVSGDVDAESVTGAIEIMEVTGYVRASTNTGKISIAGAGGIHEVHAKRGNINVEVTAIQNNTAISSQSGGITVYFAPGLDAIIEVRSSSGSISWEIPLSVIESTNNQLTAVIGEGRTRLSIQSSSGSITLKNLP